MRPNPILFLHRVFSRWLPKCKINLWYDLSLTKESQSFFPTEINTLLTEIGDLIIPIKFRRVWIGYTIFLARVSNPHKSKMALDGNSLGIEALDKVVASMGKDARIYGPKKRIPSPMKALMHNFYTVDGDIIVDYNFTHLKTEETLASDLFRVSQPISIAMCLICTNENWISVSRQIGDNFKNNSLFTSALKFYAAICGFCIRCKTDRHKECSRAGKASGKWRAFVAGDLKCNCSFYIIIKPCAYYSKVSVLPGGASKRTSRPLWDDDYYVTIRSADTEHSGGCVPSPQ